MMTLAEGFRLKYNDLREEMIETMIDMVDDRGTNGLFPLDDAHQVKLADTGDEQDAEYVIGVRKDGVVVYAPGEAERVEPFRELCDMFIVDVLDAMEKTGSGVELEDSVKVSLGLQACTEYLGDPDDEDFWYQWKADRLVDIVNALASEMDWEFTLSLNDAQPIRGADLYVDYHGCAVRVLSDVDEDIVTDGLGGFTGSMNWLRLKAAECLKAKGGG